MHVRIYVCIYSSDAIQTKIVYKLTYYIYYILANCRTEVTLLVNFKVNFTIFSTNTFSEFLSLIINAFFPF